MNEPYKVSILVPVYGAERYIERCAHSLFGQTYGNIEFVFVDDCTPDGSFDVLKRVLDDYPKRKNQIRIIKHEKNSGSAMARNTALENSTGEFVTFVDSDDYLELDAIERLVKVQQTGGADMVCAKIFINDSEPDNRYKSEPPYKSKKQYISEMLRFNAAHETVARLIRRSIFVENHIRCLPGMNIAEDFRQSVMATWYAKKITFADYGVYHYVYTPDSYCRREDSWDQLKEKRRQNTTNSRSMVEFFKDKDKDLYDDACNLLASDYYEVLVRSIKYKDKPTFNHLRSLLKKLGWKHLSKKVGWKITFLTRISFSYIVLPFYLRYVAGNEKVK